ncbi:hypothetical protein HPB52_004757 [Rhipicephalus sanguineus]|uniref:Uncharacterized protein n=1 Tax=Rhipicephalus sanguineus TaxID=34632 RepID=A0A9D4QB32_RHISA|nr:hypothetical protein HPB52_004757 [Rhipicephalus sanguineus]
MRTAATIDGSERNTKTPATEEQQTSGRIMRKSTTSSRAAANGSRGIPRVLEEHALRPIPAARLSRGKLESSREPSNHERLALLLRCRRRRGGRETAIARSWGILSARAPLEGYRGLF